MGLHIGLDLDGVMFDYTANITEWFRKEAMDAGDHQMLRRVNETSASHWHWYRDLGMTDQEFVEANGRAAAAGHLYTGGIVEGWIEAVTEIREMGHSVHIVTARFEGAPGPTAAWLAEHGVPHDALTFAKDKSRLGLDVLIDDRHENILDWVATGRHGILYNQPWNQHSNTGAIRAYNPQGVVGAIRSIALWEESTYKHPSKEPQETVLEEAQRLVHGDRGADYGHPIVDFSRTGRIWGAVLGIPDVAPQDVAMCMIGVKMSREVNRPKRDNRTDMAGYAETLDMVAEYQATHATIPAEGAS